LGEVVRDLKSLRTRIEKVRVKGPIVFTNGCFDILHVGHVRYLQEARSLGQFLVVAINSDASVRKLKGPTRPVQSESDRAEILAALSCVDYVTVFDQETPLSVIQSLEPDVLVKGGDWPVDKIVGSDVVLARGGSVRSLKFYEGRSTTSVLQRLEGK
jgi:D-beta-D-heptose 7-phosphate kinase/D-beta-D-heptose 1-phosphate adenosyltransferase